MAWDHGQIAGSPPPDTGYPAPGSLSAGDLADASPSEMPAVQLRHFFDMFEADQVFLNDPALALPLPACPKAGGPLEKWDDHSPRTTTEDAVGDNDSDPAASLPLFCSGRGVPTR